MRERTAKGIWKSPEQGESGRWKVASRLNRTMRGEGESKRGKMIERRTKSVNTQSDRYVKRGEAHELGKFRVRGWGGQSSR